MWSWTNHAYDKLEHGIQNMNGTFTSQSTNFITGINNSVNPRTGLYNITLPVVSISANNNLGPLVEINLSYDPLNQNNMGYGNGVSLGHSYYDTTNSILHLSSGEQYRITETLGQPIVLQKKLDSFRFLKEDDHYKIIWKTGAVEVLAGPRTIDKIKMPIKIFTPLGHFVEYIWEYTTGIPRLSRVQDETTNLFEVEYNKNISTRLISFPGTMESITLELVFSNQYLTLIENHSVIPLLNWNLAYSRVGEFYFLSEVSYPTGLKDVVYYESGVMKFPDNARLPALPAVVRHVTYPGSEQPEISRSYVYSDYNYLGFGGATDWNPEKDFLFGVLGNYQYWMKEILISDKTSVEFTRIFNKFHLQTEEIVVREGRKTSTEITYFAESSVLFDEQPNQFQLPKMQRVTYTDEDSKSRSEITYTEFDNWGNPTLTIEPDGRKVETSYYNAEGENGCPADVHGFVKHIKTQLTTPATTVFATPIQLVEFKYISIETFNNAPFDYAILNESEDTYINEVKVNNKINYYHNSSQSREHGRMARIKNTIISHDTTCYTNESRFDWIIEGDTLQQKITSTTWDNIEYVSYRNQSRLGGNLLSEIDSFGNTLHITYDLLGRIKTKTTNLDTEYEEVIFYEYGIITGIQNDKKSYTCATDVFGNKFRTWYDGLGRVVRSERNNTDNGYLKNDNEDNWYEISGINYDVEGREKDSFAVDLFNEKSKNNLKKVFVSSIYHYDNWGMNNITEFNDGVKIDVSYNPIELSSEQFLSFHNIKNLKTGRVKTNYTLTNLPIKISRINSQSENEGAIYRDYDGEGRLCKETDEIGNIVTWKYDIFGRVISQNLPDGSVVEKKYASHSFDRLVTEISVTSSEGEVVNVGNQSFDSLGRLLESESYGRVYKYLYEGISPVSSSVILPDGNTIQYESIPQLSFSTKSVIAKDVNQKFEYNKITGDMLSAIEDGSAINHYKYNPSGTLQQEGFHLKGDVARTANYDWSLQGLLVSYSDVTGEIVHYEYDGFGRVIEMHDSSTSLYLDYDEFGRIIKQKSIVNDSKQYTTTVMSFDDFSREISRVITFSNGDEYTIFQEYRANSQIENRSTLFGNMTLRNEKYKYDCRNRLIAYECTGTELPIDSQGKEILAQEYVWDFLNNMISCKTFFVGGNNDAIYYFENTNDPTQLTKVVNSHFDYPSCINLTYDALGRMVQDESGRILNYDMLGRLTSVQHDNTSLGFYGYDSLGKLIRQNITPDDIRYLYYKNNEIITELMHKQGSLNAARFIRSGSECIAVNELKDID